MVPPIITIKTPRCNTAVTSPPTSVPPHRHPLPRHCSCNNNNSSSSRDSFRNYIYSNNQPTTRMISFLKVCIMISITWHPLQPLASIWWTPTGQEGYWTISTRWPSIPSTTPPPCTITIRVITFPERRPTFTPVTRPTAISHATDKGHTQARVTFGSCSNCVDWEAFCSKAYVLIYSNIPVRKCFSRLDNQMIFCALAFFSFDETVQLFSTRRFLPP